MEAVVDLDQAMRYLHDGLGRTVLVHLGFGDQVLARFRMRLAEAEAMDDLLTLIGDLDMRDDAPLYSELNLPLPGGDGRTTTQVQFGELRIDTTDGFTLQVAPIEES